MINTRAPDGANKSKNRKQNKKQMSKYKQVPELPAGSALDGWAFRFSFLTVGLSNANSNQMNNLQRFKLGKIF